MGIRPRERWREKGSDIYWTVMSVNQDKGYIGVSGPGPCRAYKTVDFEEFMANWERCVD